MGQAGQGALLSPRLGGGTGSPDIAALPLLLLLQCAPWGSLPAPPAGVSAPLPPVVAPGPLAGLHRLGGGEKEPRQPPHPMPGSSAFGTGGGAEDLPIPPKTPRESQKWCTPTPPGATHASCIPWGRGVAVGAGLGGPGRLLLLCREARCWARIVAIFSVGPNAFLL